MPIKLLEIFSDTGNWTYHKLLLSWYKVTNRKLIGNLRELAEKTRGRTQQILLPLDSHRHCLSINPL